MWNIFSMRFKLPLLTCLAASLLVTGCGKDEVVKVDNGSGQDGVLRRDIDKAKDVGAQESSYQKSGESVAYGESK